MNRRDLELLSSYLDGQLKQSDSARLETRLASDRDLRALLDELREARTLLRRLPARKAPRNFTLTHEMVGSRPPMPRAYPTFRFVTTLATLLLFFTFGLNFLAPQLYTPGSPFGMGGGGAPEVFSAQDAPATESAAAAEPAAEEPPAELLPPPTDPASTQDSARNGETPAEKDIPAEEPAVREEASPLVPTGLQLLLAAIIIVGALLMLLMRQAAVNRWRR